MLFAGVGHVTEIRIATAFLAKEGRKNSQRKARSPEVIILKILLENDLEILKIGLLSFLGNQRFF